MNKKSLLVVILAGILALVGALVLLKSIKKEPSKQVVQEEQIVIPESEHETTAKLEETAEETKLTEEETKPAVSQPVKKVSYKKTAKKTTAAKQPVIKPIVVKEAGPVQNGGIIQEEESKDIVITEEYKIKSPARYIFK